MIRYYIAMLLLSTNFAPIQGSLMPSMLRIAYRSAGLVTYADSLQQIPNASILVNGQPFGFATDTSGYFSIFAQLYDTITFTSLL
ncbi:hypothetical protein OKW21_001159 [Catalinimonas alkaloidigena]|uniref:hypothetical protein n=1 Tax=Catalinimonas alkaloidigena TaxID=1075417 RepID=UPI0024063013|nr:hypothetical protein [Catalinimonas alkaloidigena]MDF9795896.1 hypothetical protein [Catalinimonas alkaloidigena]